MAIAVQQQPQPVDTRRVRRRKPRGEEVNWPLTGILSIPGEVYEAAAMDGASPTRRLISITLPLVAGYVVINLIIGFKNHLNAYDIIVGLTNGGPGTETFSVAMTIFTGFTSGDYAYQMANAVVFFIVTVVFSLVQLRFISGRDVSL